MNAREIHIALDSGIRGVNPRLHDSFINERKDFIFNYVMMGMIREWINVLSSSEDQPSEKITYQDLSDIRQTIKKPVYSGTNTNEVFCILPPNLLELDTENISAEVNIGSAPRSSLNTKYIAKTELKDDADLYSQFKIIVDSTTIFNISDYPAINSILTGNEVKYYLINLILEEVNRKGIVEVYWERYYDIYEPNNFVFVSSTNVSTLIFDHKNVDYEVDFTSRNFTSKFISESVVKTNPVRIVNANFSYTATDPFNKTSYESPLGKYEEGLIKVLHDETFVITNLSVTLYRKPVFLNLALDRAPNLKKSILNAAIEKTIVFIKNSTLNGVLNEVIK